MSDKVTPLHPEKERRRKIRRRVLSLAGVLVLVLATVCIILFHQELNLDRLRRYFTYLTVRDSGNYGEYAFEAHSSNACGALEDGLAVASVAGLDLYGPSGEALGAVPNAVSAPALAVGSHLAMAWDVGGTVLSAASFKDGTVLDLDVGRPLLDADISGEDQICYAMAADGYKTVLTVLNERQRESYKWYSSSQYLPLCAISDGGALLAAVAVGQSGGAFESQLLLLPTGQEEAGPTAQLGNQLILDLEFVSPKRICTVGESSLQFFDLEGAPQGEYQYSDRYLKDFGLGGDGFVALSLNAYQAGSRYSVVTVDLNGEEIADCYLGEEILSLSAAGNYVAVLTADHLRIFTSDLALYAETEDVMGASGALMREDGSALLTGSGSAHLYLP